MRTALAVISFAALAGCPSEADVVLDLHRASSSSGVSIDVCDDARPEDCNGPEGIQFGEGNVSHVGIYFDDAITPPLRLWLEQFSPVVCRHVTLDPARERDTIVIRFPDADEDLMIEHCATCAQSACP